MSPQSDSPGPNADGSEVVLSLALHDAQVLAVAADKAKLSVARQQDAPRVLIALKAYERECLVLAQLVSPTDGSARSWTALCMDCTREAVYSQLQVEIDWSTRTRRRINEFLERTQ